MNQKTCVLDMNVLQSAQLAERLKIESSTRYILPDVALVEMCKKPEWQLTMRLALQGLKDSADDIQVTLSIGEALSIELKRLIPIKNDEFLSEPFTDLVRNLVRLFAQDAAEVDAELEGKVLKARELLLKAELNADDAKARTKTHIDLLVKGLNPKIIKGLRSPSLAPERLVSFAYGVAHAYSWDMLVKNHGMSSDAAADYLELKPLLMRYQFLVVHNCLIHLKNAVVMESFGAHKELNNQLDFDFALTASYFDEVFSNDNGLLTAYAALKVVADTPHSILAETATEWLTEIGVTNK